MDSWLLDRRAKEIEIEELVRSCVKPYHVDVAYAFLHNIVFPNVMLARMMKKVVLDIKTETERYILQEKVESKRTEELVKAVLNSANEVNASAVATSKKIEVVADAEAEKVKTMINGDGLKSIKSNVSLASTDQILSYYFLNSLRLLASNERLLVAQQHNSTKSYNKASGSFSETLAVAAAGLAKVKP